MIINKKSLSKYKNLYNKNGFIVVREFLDINKVNEMKLDLEKFIKKFSSRCSRDINFSDPNIINSVHHMDDWKWTKKLRRNKKLMRLAEELIDNNIDDFGAELFAKPAKVGLKSPPHQDNFYWCLDDANGLTVWLALDSSSRHNGGVYYYSGSHRKKLLQHVNSFAPGSSQKVKHLNSLRNCKIITPSLKPGDCLIHHSLVVHGSAMNKSERSRIGLTIRYKSKESKIDEKMKYHYEKELVKQIDSRKNTINARF